MGCASRTQNLRKGYLSVFEGTEFIDGVKPERGRARFVAVDRSSMPDEINLTSVWSRAEVTNPEFDFASFFSLD